jgi:hypothetical protein
VTNVSVEISREAFGARDLSNLSVSPEREPRAGAVVMLTGVRYIEQTAREWSSR